MSSVLIQVRPDLAKGTQWVSTIPAGEATASPQAPDDYLLNYQFAGSQWVGGEDIFVPIPARVELVDGNTFLVTNSETGIFGAGFKLSEAFVDFRLALHEHRDALEAAGTLSDDLHDQLMYLNRHIRRAR